MIDVGKSLAIIAVIATITAIFRFAPFLIFSKNPPKQILYLGKVLPPAVMSMLIVYCLKNISFTTYPFGVPELIAMMFVIIVHRWRRNTLLSVAGGTLFYMLMMQVVFI